MIHWTVTTPSPPGQPFPALVSDGVTSTDDWPDLAELERSVIEHVRGALRYLDGVDADTLPLAFHCEESTP